MYKDSGPSNLLVSVINMQGQRVTLDINYDMSVEAISDESVKKLVGSHNPGTSDPFVQYSLIRINDQHRRLSNKNTARAENLTTGDVLLLYKTQGKGSKAGDEVTSRSIPTLPGIRKATESLISKDKDFHMTSDESVQTSSGNLEHTFRKILLTLLDLSYKLMFFDKEADGLFCRKKKRNEINQSLATPLIEMGFSKTKSLKALKMCHMDVQAAMEWLLQHPDEDGTEEMTVDEDSADSASDEDKEMDSSKQVLKRLEEYQKKTRRLRPNKQHVSFLVGMGFSKEDSIQALRLNGNNPNSACDWLLGDRKVPEEDPNDSLSPDSALYKAIISNPTIHIGLHNQRVLEALEDMLENPLRRHNWANDPTVGSVILQILKLYHKYSTSGS